MPRVFEIAGLTVLGVVVAGCAAAAIGSIFWNRETARLMSRLGAPTRQPGGGARFSPDQLAGLPAPVVRYFLFALMPGQRLIRRAEIRHTGQFAMQPNEWRPFTSTEHFVVQPPGFLWDATIRMAGLVPVRVHDSYSGSEGALRATIAGLVTVADQHGTPEMAAGELLRYLAEAVWFPTALLPSAGVHWDPIEGSTARVALRDGENAVSMEVRFGADGRITRISAERPRTVGNMTVLTPWVGSLGDYGKVEGMRVPMTGEVAWERPGGRQPYWRGQVERATYTFEP